jgi:hypothetical protein
MKSPAYNPGLLQLPLRAQNALYQTWQAFCLTMGWPGLQPHAF